MISQLENRIVSNFLLMIDHQIQSRGQAYFNASGLFYSVPSHTSNRYTYAAPYKQLCNDVSITGATVLSGVYLNGNFVTVGQSGLMGINHYKGALYFNQALPSNTVVSGNYSVKEVNVELSDLSESKLLFETKYTDNRQRPQTFSGLAIDTKTAPVVYVIVKGQENLPWAFNRVQDGVMALRCVVITDNEFQNVAVSSILKNLNEHYVPMFSSLPITAVGMMTGVNLNYNQLPTDGVWYPWIRSVRGIDIPQKGDFEDIERSMSMLDFEISTVQQV